MPCSSIPFSVRTRIIFALRIVVSLWAIVNTVLPFASFSSESCTIFSLSLSSAEVASSRISIDGFFKNTLAILIHYQVRRLLRQE